MEGGFNEEHEVSLSSSSAVKKVLTNLNVNYKVLRVNPKNFEKKILKYKNYICFNALHGPFGEDGQIQKILKQNKIKFTHSNFKSSKNSFNKILTKKIVFKKNILTPKSKILSLKDLKYEKLIEIKKIFKKFVIKPISSGSSYCTKIIKTNKDFKKFFKNIKEFKKEASSHKEFLIEEFISGKELTVSTINFGNRIEALAVTEIKTRNKFFDYQAKYSRGYAKHTIPAKISKKNYNKCLKLAISCHKFLECNSIARSDFIYNPKANKIYFLEINTQPGLTSISLLPEQANFKKISFEKLVMNILEKTI